MKKVSVMLLTLILFLSLQPLTSISKDLSSNVEILSENKRMETLKKMLLDENCEWEGIKLYGKVQFVESFPDIKIQYVESFPDIKVKFVDAFPDDCGEWQEVKSFPDFKVQVVTSFPDLKVKKVQSFPGMN